jgi:hypothetical protein
LANRPLMSWRRGWDSNPEGPRGLAVFKFDNDRFNKFAPELNSAWLFALRHFALSSSIPVFPRVPPSWFADTFAKTPVDHGIFPLVN